MSRADQTGLSRLPSMTVLLKAAEASDALAAESTVLVTEALRDALAEARSRLQEGGGEGVAADPASLVARAKAIIESQRANRLVRVINATGVALHTNLGRSVLSEAAVERINEVARGYCNLEVVLATGGRGKRGQYIESLLRRLTGAEAALIVNNNAAATMMVLHCLAKGREVVLSRGQLIEIGGSFRMPEVMAAGGAILRDVGTTNKTHLRDYEQAICDQTAMLMHVHTSNYRVVGFSQSPSIEELAALAHGRGLLMFDDLGSGALLDDPIWSAAQEPTVAASLRVGCDVVSFSGDKLLGGPQAGIILGKKSVLDGLRGNPMARALRIDKLTIAAMEATLELYFSPETVKQRIPILASLSEPVDRLRGRAEELAARLRRALPQDAFEAAEDESFAGGGSLPAWPLPTVIVRWRPAGGGSLDTLTQRLRLGRPSVLPRLHDEAVIFDLRTIREHEFDEIVAAAASARR